MTYDLDYYRSLIPGKTQSEVRQICGLLGVENTRAMSIRLENVVSKVVNLVNWFTLDRPPLSFGQDSAIGQLAESVAGLVKDDESCDWRSPVRSIVQADPFHYDRFGRSGDSADLSYHGGGGTFPFRS